MIARIARFVWLFRPTLLMVLLVGALTCPYWLRWFRTISEEELRFAQVHVGMSEEQVLDVLGQPPGDYGPPGALYAWQNRHLCWFAPKKSLMWGGHCGRLEVVFGHFGASSELCVVQVFLWRRLSVWDHIEEWLPVGLSRSVIWER